MGTTRENGSLYTKIDQKVATVEFGHPASNSFVAELLNRLTKEINALSENDEISVIILKSEGDRAFCGGASFSELMAVSNLEEGKVFFIGNGVAKTKELITHENAIFVEGKLPSANDMSQLAYQKYKKSDIEDVAYFEPYYLKDFIAINPNKK